MGQLNCKLWKKKNVKILMMGLDAAGKTTILYTLKLGEVVTTIPTIGFNVETIEDENLKVSFTAWDVGGRDKIRPLLRHYYPSTDAIIYIIDSNDRERLHEALEEFERIREEDELRESEVLLLCNKQDLAGALTVNEINEKLKKDIYGHGIGVFAVSGLDRKSLMEPLLWLSERLATKKTRRLATESLAEAKEIIKPIINPVQYIKQSWTYIKSLIQ